MSEQGCLLCSKPTKRAASNELGQSALAQSEYDLEAVGGFCGQFTWSEVGLPAGLSVKEQLEFKLNHIENALKKLDAVESAIRSN